MWNLVGPDNRRCGSVVDVNKGLGNTYAFKASLHGLRYNYITFGAVVDFNVGGNPTAMCARSRFCFFYAVAFWVTVSAGNHKGKSANVPELI